ncbi:putative oxidoreductase [Aspergillus unguis]
MKLTRTVALGLALSAKHNLAMAITDSSSSGRHSSGTGACCLALSSVLGDKVSFPKTSEYNASLNYFSQQNANFQPACIVSPTESEDVSTAISILTSPKSTHQSKCQFAIRSGGHASQVGVSNINGGVTFDLSRLNTLHLSDDRTALSAGAGATWGEVYAFLDSQRLSAAGGRANQVGVGGLTVGGGISYYGPRYGWTCDTVTEFEVVLAGGKVIKANKHENPDLLTALRGGGNNFGIVTKVTLNVFEQGPIWAGSVYYSVDTIDDQLRAFEKLNDANGYDEYASLITSFGFATGRTAIVNSIVYTKAEENPKVYEPFTDIPSLMSTVHVRSMQDMSIEQGSFSPDGNRQKDVVITHGTSFDMLKAVYNRWNASRSVVEGISGLSWSISLEPLPPAIYARNLHSNSLGLDDTSGALVITLLAATWSDAADDAKIEKAARDLFDGIEEDARRLKMYHPFKYMNYAAEYQDPIASYGKESVEFLKKVRREYDPHGVFHKDVPGGFKIPGGH